MLLIVLVTISAGHVSHAASSCLDLLGNEVADSRPREIRVNNRLIVANPGPLPPTLKKAVKYFNSEDSEAILNMENVIVRIIRVSPGKPEDANSLTNSPDRRTVFLTNNIGLVKFAGFPQSHPEGEYYIDPLLRESGYEPNDILYYHKNKTEFKLVIIPNEKSLGLPATWENLRIVMEQAYPNTVVGSLFAKYFADLSQRSFDEIQAQAPRRFADLKELGRDDAHHITADKLTKDSSLWEFRAFLFNIEGVAELYNGDGFTKRPDGQPGVPEFLSPNFPFNSLSDYVIMDLPL